MTSKVVNHVTLGAEALAAVLGAFEGAQVVMHTHVHRQVVPVVENLVTTGDWAGEVRPALVVREMSLETALEVKLLLAAWMGALEGLLGRLIVHLCP